MEMFLTEREIRKLLLAASQAREHSYAPYSHYPVGAAVLTEDERIFSGCNVENASYPAGLCAERNAIGSAVSAGILHFRGMAIIGSQKTYTMPCGICRQVMAEFHIPYVVCGINLWDYKVYRVEELLPHGFSM